MRQSSLRAHAVPARDHRTPAARIHAVPAREDRLLESRIKDAGLSGARALTRLLVALIESLGAHDKAGRPTGPGWPHGAMRTAFGPVPHGGETERTATPPAHEQAPASPRPSAAHPRHAGLEQLLRQNAGEAALAPPSAAPARVPASPSPAPPRPQRPERIAQPEGLDAARMLRSAKPKGVPPATPPPPDPLAAMPAWQRPFIAAPGVRYMRTPDHLLKTARGRQEAMPPIEPGPAAAASDDAPAPPVDSPLASSPDPASPATAAAADPFFNPDEDALQIEDQTASRPASSPRAA